jgi:hypothetical protein
MDKLVKIETETKQTFRSKSTNKTYDTKEEFLRNHKEEDLAIDTAVTVTNKGLDLLQKVMKHKCKAVLEAELNYN